MDAAKLRSLFDMTGRVVIVTGGTRGIGRAIVEGFLAEGANVAFCDRHVEWVPAKGPIFTYSTPPAIDYYWDPLSP